MEYLDPQPELVAVTDANDGRLMVFLKAGGKLLSVVARPEEERLSELASDLHGMAAGSERLAHLAPSAGRNAVAYRRLGDALDRAFAPAAAEAKDDGCPYCGAAFKHDDGQKVYECGTRTRQRPGIRTECQSGTCLERQAARQAPPSP